jgi:hypothetical protein
MAQQVDPDQFTTPFMPTPTKRRDPYPAIDPSKPSNFQKGKIIIITGASGGIGAVRQSPAPSTSSTNSSRLLPKYGLAQEQQAS